MAAKGNVLRASATSLGSSGFTSSIGRTVARRLDRDGLELRVALLWRRSFRRLCSWGAVSAEDSGVSPDGVSDCFVALRARSARLCLAF
jgi:hypothetical protein